MDVTLDTLLKTNYVKFGRETPNLDCWGLARLARHHLFGRELLPAYDTIDPGDKASLTKAALLEREVGGFLECEPRPGAIALAWRGGECVHIGVVVETDGRLWVLETEEGVGPTLTRVPVFERSFAQVVYYDN